MKLKSIFLYALAIALLTFLLNWADYHFYVRDLRIEAYLILVAIIFATLGAWLAYTLVSIKSGSTKGSAKSIKTTINNLEGSELSERELEVLSCIAQGLSNQQIGEKLNISLSTVKTHNSNLFSKLGVKRRTQAIIKAQKLGVITHSLKDYSNK